MNEITTADTFESNTKSMLERAKIYAKSKAIPANYRNNPESILIAMEMADRVGIGPVEVMQNMHEVYGNPCFKSEYIIARVNSSGLIQGRINWEFVGEPGDDNYGARAYAFDKSTGERLVGTLVTIKMAKDEGWYDRKGSKWKTMEEQMIRYRSATFLARAFFSDAIMGMQTVEEIHDITERDITPRQDQQGASTTLIPATEKLKVETKQHEVIEAKRVESEKADDNVEQRIEDASLKSYNKAREILKTLNTKEELETMKNSPLIGQMEPKHSKAFNRELSAKIEKI